jgi:hypothetical protein
MKNGRDILVALLFVILWIAQPAVFFAQTVETASISGKLTDDHGAAVAGAVATAVESITGKSNKASTDSSGAYTLKLAPGSYTVRFTAGGFKTAEVQKITLLGGKAVDVSAALVRGSEAEVVALPWVAPAETGTQKGDTSVKNLPLSSRNYTQASGLATGVSSQVTNATAIGMNTQGVQVGSASTNSYLMDGAPVSASAGGPESPGIPNPDAIAENSVLSWSYSAGPERYAGANMIVTTKSGTDAFHGTLFEFLRNDIFNANDFFLKQRGFREPVLKQNQFGFTVGGPVLSGRVFFFASYQGTRQSNGLAMSGFSPSVILAPIPSGDRSSLSFQQALGAEFCSANHPGDQRYQTVFGGEEVDCSGSNINSVALKILNLKLANGDYLIPGSSNGTFQQTPYSIPAKFREDQALINTDYVLTAKEKLIERFFYARDPQTENFTGPGALPGSPSTNVTGNLYGAVKLISTLTPRLTNELRISGQHNLTADNPNVPYKDSDVGITPVVPSINQIDSVYISGLFGIGGGGTWDHYGVNQYQAADLVSWTHGKQSIKFGIEVERRQWNTNILGGAIGWLVTQGFDDFLVGLPGCPPSDAGCLCNTGNSPDACTAANTSVNGALTYNGTSYSNIFSSQGNNGSPADVTGPGGIFHAYRYSDTSAYLQDNFKLLSRLTVNLGMRWDYFGLPSDSTGNMTSFWPSVAGQWTGIPADKPYLGFLVPSNFRGALAAGVTRNTRNTLLPIGTPRANVAPRLGLAWQPTNKDSFVVRGGYGIFFDRPDASTLNSQSTAEAPYAVPVGGAAAANYQASLAVPFPSAQPYSDTASGWGAARSADFTEGTSSNLSVMMLDESFSTPLTQKWNLQIEQRLPLGLTLDVGYAGAHSVRLFDSGRHINEPALASESNPVYGLTVNTVGNASLRVPYLGLSPSGLGAYQTQGSAKYNALQVTIQEQASNGLHVQGAYGFSKTLSNLGAAPGPGGSNAMNSNDPLDARQQYGPSMTAPQRLAVNYGWDFPWKGSGLRGKLLSGWGVSGMTIIQSGTPMTINDSHGGTIYGSAGISRAQFCPGMGARNAGKPGSVKDRLNGYFNLNAFADTSATSNSSSCVMPQIGDGTGYGDSGMGIILGPGQNNSDLSVSRKFTIKESNLLLRAEFFNAFNHPQFSQPDQNLTDPSFGEITSMSVNPRLIQLALKYTF